MEPPCITEREPGIRAPKCNQAAHLNMGARKIDREVNLATALSVDCRCVYVDTEERRRRRWWNDDLNRDNGCYTVSVSLSLG
jgi:hypothetical protein